MMLAAVVPESSAADSPALNPGALSSHIDLCPHIAHAGGIIFTVGTEHANLPPAGVGDVDHLGLSGLFSEISGNWPVALAGAGIAQTHASCCSLCPWGPHLSLQGSLEPQPLLVGNQTFS